MKKSNLVRALSDTFDITIRDAELCVNTFFDSMADTMADGRRIEIRGFGSFKVRDYKSYLGRNPKTGKPLQVRGKRLPLFKMSTILKQLINKEPSE